MNKVCALSIILIVLIIFLLIAISMDDRTGETLVMLCIISVIEAIIKALRVNKKKGG